MALGKEFEAAQEMTRFAMQPRPFEVEQRILMLRKWAKEFEAFCIKKQRSSTWLEDVKILLSEIDRLEGMLK